VFVFEFVFVFRSSGAVGVPAPRSRVEAAVRAAVALAVAGRELIRPQRRRHHEADPAVRTLRQTHAHRENGKTSAARTHGRSEISAGVVVANSARCDCRRSIDSIFVLPQPSPCPFSFCSPTVLKSGSQFGGQLHGSPSSTGALLCRVTLRPANGLKSITTS